MFPNESAFLGVDNNHSGVQQWYRWTINPVDPFPNGLSVCEEDDFAEGKKPSSFDDSLNPCQQGWYWSLNNHPEAFPPERADNITQISQLPLPLTQSQEFGCDIAVNGSVTTINCKEQSSPFILASVDIPEDANALSFEYSFQNSGDGDYAAVLIDDLPIWVVSGSSVVEENVFIESGPIPLGGLQGAHTITIVLYGVGALNAEFTIRNLQVSSVSNIQSLPLAAVLPTSRSVQVGNTATAFATIINTGSATATGCRISPLTNLPASFAYQTTDAVNALVGTPDTPVDIAAGGNQSYVFAFTPTASFSPVDVRLTFDCTNTSPASVTAGLNTLLLVADSNPVPDIVALAATLTGDGIVNLASTGVFAVATVNVGIADTITVSADTGDASLPVSISLCETNPATGACINPTVPTSRPVTTSIAADATPTFAFFVTSTDTVPFDPADNRIFVRFQDAGGVTRGSTSVAVRTL